MRSLGPTTAATLRTRPRGSAATEDRTSHWARSPGDYGAECWDGKAARIAVAPHPHTDASVKISTSGMAFGSGSANVTLLTFARNAFGTNKRIAVRPHKQCWMEWTLRSSNDFVVTHPLLRVCREMTGMTSLQDALHVCTALAQLNRCPHADILCLLLCILKLTDLGS